MSLLQQKQHSTTVFKTNDALCKINGMASLYQPYLDWGWGLMGWNFLPHPLNRLALTIPCLLLELPCLSFRPWHDLPDVARAQLMCERAQMRIAQPSNALAFQMDGGCGVGLTLHPYTAWVSKAQRTKSRGPKWKLGPGKPIWGQVYPFLWWI